MCFPRETRRRGFSPVFFAKAWIALLPAAIMGPGVFAAPPVGPAEEKLSADGPALLREWTPPIYPAAALKARTSGMVDVRLIVDETGRVTQARALEGSDEAFVEAALAAVRAWGFAPATGHGQAVASCLDTQVIFSPARGQEKPSEARIPPESQTLSPAPRTSPVPRNTAGGEYPAELVERKIPGVVQFACTVTAEGRVAVPQILAASHADFVLPALQALQQWEFVPAKQGDLAVAAPVETKVMFDDIFRKDDEVLAANGITAPDGNPPAATTLPSYVADPVWPLDLLLKGEGGEATVEFTVAESGSVRNLRVRSSTQPEFGAALAAAVEGWGFRPPVGTGENLRTSVALVKREEFKAIPLDAMDGSAPLARLVQALRRGEVGGAKGLDEKLTPLYRVRPNYPATLTGGEAVAGRAEIEFVVDRDGRARLPRIVSATRPEFGWAAATAVAQWIFRSPRRGGEPVDVKVRIPFEFAVPTE